MAAQGIASQPVMAAATYPLPGLAAEASAPLDASARVVVPYAGVVTRLLVDEGAMVERGQALASIQSREALAAQAALISARSDALAASSQARRDRELLAAGVVPAARDEQSRARAAAAQGVLQQAEGAMAHLRMARDGMPGEYSVTAPMSGQVLRRDVDTGQAVDALASAFLIARPGPLDVRFNLPVQYRDVIAIGQTLQLPTGGTAVVQAIGADTDAATQSLRVRARLESPGNVVAGQQFAVTLQVPAPEGSLRVPGSALLPAGRGHTVYRIDSGRIESIAVQRVLGNDGDHAVIVAAGLQPGQSVVSRGTAMLKAMVPATAPRGE
jgi:RND family efflux transporter MFP subunit